MYVLQLAPASADRSIRAKLMAGPGLTAWGQSQLYDGNGEPQICDDRQMVFAT